MPIYNSSKKTSVWWALGGGSVGHSHPSQIRHAENSTRLSVPISCAPLLSIGCIMATTNLSPFNVPLHEYVHSHVLTEDTSFGAFTITDARHYGIV